VHYPEGQVITCIVPNLRCTKWFAFRGRIVDSPRSICAARRWTLRSTGPAGVGEGDGRLHTVVCYGDYLREAGYAVKKAGSLEWKNYSEEA